MGKSKKTAAAEVAQAAAQRVLENKTAIKKLQMAIADDMEVVENWASSTGEKTLGDILIFERKNPPKLVFPPNIDIDALMFALSYQHTRRIIETSAICKAVETDQNLKQIFERFGLSVSQESTIQIKHL